MRLKSYAREVCYHNRSGELRVTIVSLVGADPHPHAVLPPQEPNAKLHANEPTRKTTTKRDTLWSRPQLDAVA